MNYQELENKSLQELSDMVKELRLKFGEFRFKKGENSLKDTSVLQKTRRDIARIMTAIGKKEGIRK